jgi:RHS repeat-associated protein
VVSDVKLPAARVLSHTDYYAFGSAMPSRSGGSYRYGFNTQERSPELAPDHHTAEFWEYDARIGRRWNVDPRPTVGISEYAAFAGNPVRFNDVKGDTLRFAAGMSERFRTEVINAISKLMMTEEGSRIVLHLMSSKETYYISEGSNGVVHPRNTQGLHAGDISWDPNSTDGGLDENSNRSRPPWVALGHELRHTEDIDAGTFANTPFLAPDGHGLPLYEVKAVDSENKIRAEAGKALRKYYGIQGTKDGSTGQGQLLTEQGQGTHLAYSTNYRQIRKIKVKSGPKRYAEAIRSHFSRTAPFLKQVTIAPVVPPIEPMRLPLNKLETIPNK